MKAQMVKWGNSLAVRIPKPIIEEARLKEPDLEEIGAKSFFGEVENQYSPSQSCESQGHSTLREIQISCRREIVHLAPFTLSCEILLRARSGRAVCISNGHRKQQCQTLPHR